MKKYNVVFNREKCVSCRACMIACMDQNDIDIEAGEQPFRRVFTSEIEKNGSIVYCHLSLSCRHCQNAPCIEVCPRGCIKKDEETELTIYDTTDCIGCGRCAVACPFQIPSMGKNGKMKKCDGCYVRIHNKMKPVCVKACPTGALSFSGTLL